MRPAHLGKRILIGEYAVLEGSSALSAAVATRAVADIASTTAEHSQLCIANTGDEFAFVLAADGQINWLEAPGQSGLLLDAAVGQLVDTVASALCDQAVKVTLDTRDFYVADSRNSLTKTGTGSSAALSVALTAAMQGYCGAAPDFETSARVHRSFQRGKGSGVDVVTSWHGGVVALRRSGNAANNVVRSEWPDGPHVLPVWTGVAASTPAMLEQLDVYRQDSPAGWQQLRMRLSDIAAAALISWEAMEITDFLSQIELYARALEDLDDAAGIGIWSAEHRQLSTIANASGAVYKPSGAGGGDYGLAFMADAAGLDRLRAQFAEAGFAGPVPDWTSRGLELNDQQASR